MESSFTHLFVTSPVSFYTGHEPVLYKIVVSDLLSLLFMLFFHLCKIILFFTCFFFIYITMYILNIADTVTKCQSMNSEILSLKTIMNELDLLKRKVIIQ